MNLAHKIELRNDMSKEQITALKKSCGIYRFTYNYALSEYKRQLDAGFKPDIYQIKKYFNSIKKEQYPWVYECPKWANHQPFIDLKSAFTKFFKEGSGFPTLKKKGKKDSFYINQDHIKVSKNRIRLGILGWYNLTESLRFKGTLKYVTVSRTANKWFVSINVEIPDYKKQRISNKRIGIDVGLKHNFVTSGNEVIQCPQPLKQGLKKLRKLSKEHSRKTKGSENRKKSQMKLAKHHYKISCIRKDFINQLTTKLCEENQFIGVESLSIKSWYNMKTWRRKVSDLGLGEFFRQLQYKGEIYDCNIIYADNFYPSTQTCSRCKTRKIGNKKLQLWERVFICEECGLLIDRDLNASLNLLHLTYNNKDKYTESSSGINACGHKIRPDSNTSGIVAEAGKILSYGNIW